ncbi:hypothetical protein C8F01DRAFT_1369911, partial [Mycena amicta]
MTVSLQSKTHWRAALNVHLLVGKLFDNGCWADNQYGTRRTEDMKSTFALFASLAVVIASVSGVAVEPRATRLFNIYPTLAPEAAPVEQAKRGECPKSFASADSLLLTMKNNQATQLFNIYPTLAPEAAPVEQAKREYLPHPCPVSDLLSVIIFPDYSSRTQGGGANRG